MSETYNVLYEKWISVTDLSGKAKRVGLLEALTQAKDIKEIVYSNPMEEFAVYRLLMTLLMDAVRPLSIDDIDDLLEQGYFPEIDDYVKKCELEGASFDLFDENRPFLQATPDKSIEKETRPASYLDCTIPFGNNAVHFNHLTGSKGIAFQDIPSKLAMCQLFAVAGIQGFPSSINGAPPYFTVIKGDNLFETLCYMMVPIEEITGEFDNPPVYWRSDMNVEPKKQVTRTSLLYGLLFPARRIRIIPNWETRTAEDIYWAQGINFNAPENWTDPHVTYRTNSNGRFPWRPDIDRAVWRNLSDLIDVRGQTAPKVLDVYSRLQYHHRAFAAVTLYGVQTNQASHDQIVRYDMRIAKPIIDDSSSVSIIRECIAKAEETAKRISKTFQDGKLDEGLQLELAKTRESVVQKLFDDCESGLWNLCNETLPVNSSEKIQACSQMWNQLLVSSVRTHIKHETDKLGLSGKDWITLYQCLLPLNSYLSKLMKEGE